MLRKPQRLRSRTSRKWCGLSDNVRILGSTKHHENTPTVPAARCSPRPVTVLGVREVLRARGGPVLERGQAARQQTSAGHPVAVPRAGKEAGHELESTPYVLMILSTASPKGLQYDMGFCSKCNMIRFNSLRSTVVSNVTLVEQHYGCNLTPSMPSTRRSEGRVPRSTSVRSCLLWSVRS